MSPNHKTNTFRMIATNKGFSLIEILIVLVISTIIAMACLSLLLDFVRVRKDSSYHQELFHTSEKIFRFITEDLHNSKNVSIQNNNLVIASLTDESVVYSVNDQDNRLYRLEQPITSENVIIEDMNATIINPESAIVLVKIQVKILNPALQNQSITRSTTISLRTNRVSNL